MKTEDFIRSLHNSQILPDAVMERLEDKLERADKNVSPKSIAKYLIDKGYLSKYQAKQLLTGELTPADEIELQVPIEQSQDTDDLLGDLKPPLPTAPAAQLTRQEDASGLGKFDDNIEIVEVEHEETMLHGLQPDFAGVPDAAHIDPMAGFGFDSGESPVEDITVHGSFAGKKARANQWESKWLFIGFGLLGFFILAGIILAVTLFKTDASKMWEDAVNDFNKGNYQVALPKLIQYVKDYPGDDKHADALVKIANCKLRVPYDSRNWENTLGLAKTVLPELNLQLEEIDQVAKFDEIRSELSVILPGTALGFTEVAIAAPDVPGKQAQLDLAIQARDLIDQSAYVPTSYKRNPGVDKVLRELSDNISIVERQIQMENDYAQALIEITQLTTEGKTTDAFQAYYQLVGQYPILSIREEMRNTISAISDREAELVTAIPAGVTAAAVEPSPINRTTVFATRSGQTTIPGIGDRMLVSLIQGALYGIKAATGEIVWRKFVGLETTTQPVWLDEQQTGNLIAVDGMRNHLFNVSGATGTENWRLDIGESFCQPNVTADRILLTTRSGKLISVDPLTGETTDAARLPQGADVSPVTISQSPLAYQIGHDSNLYVISTEDMSCREVYYLGHRPGSIVIPPFAMSEYLIIAENGADYCKLHVLRPAENGLMLERAQPSIRLDGQVSEPIVRHGRWGLVISDKGDMRMLELNKASEAEPVTVVVSRRTPPSRPTRKFLLAREGQLWNAAAGLRRYKIQKAAGDFKEEGVEDSLDTFVAPLALINDTLFHVRRRHDSALVSVSAVDATSLEEIWRNDFAAPLAGIAHLNDSRMAAVSSQGDVFELNAQILSQNADNTPFARGSTVVQSLIFDNVLQFGNDMFVAVGPAERQSIIAVDVRRDPASQLSDLKSPANRPACRPVKFGDYLLVAALRGQVFRIDPLTGNPVGAPFQPELQPNVDVQWREPAVMSDNETFIIGNAKGEFFLVAADDLNSLSLMGQLTHDARLISPLISVDNGAAGVCRGANDQLVRLGGEQKLELQKSVDLPGGYMAGPIPLGNGNFIVMLDSGTTACFDRELNLVWQADIPADKLAGLPTMIDGNLLLAYESGAILTLDPANGDVSGRLNLGQPISGAPVPFGDSWLVPGNDGTLHQLDQLSSH